jgi:hypothetical protein
MQHYTHKRIACGTFSTINASQPWPCVYNRNNDSPSAYVIFILKYNEESRRVGNSHWGVAHRGVVRVIRSLHCIECLKNWQRTRKSSLELNNATHLTSKDCKVILFLFYCYVRYFVNTTSNWVTHDGQGCIRTVVITTMSISNSNYEPDKMHSWIETWLHV